MSFIILEHFGILSDGGANANATDSHKPAKADDVIYYPWESLLCADDHPEACKDFKPFCSIMEVIAFRKCRKTCGLCKQDRPANKGGCIGGVGGVCRWLGYSHIDFANPGINFMRQKLRGKLHFAEFL